MRSNTELRFGAVLIGGSLICTLVLWGGHRLSGEFLFPRALFGFISSLVIGIPLILLGDRYWSRFKGRYLASGMAQGLVIYLFFGGFSLQLLKLAVSGGVALGVWYHVVIPWVESWGMHGRTPVRWEWRSVLAIPIAGGLALGGAAALYFAAQGGAPLFFVLFFVIGALISMVVCWPMLWLVERFLITPWRYLIGGAGSGFLIWLILFVPMLIDKPVKNVVALSPVFWLIFATFILIGVIAGLLYTAFTWKRKCGDS